MPAYVSTPLKAMIIIVNRENPSVKFELYLIEINIPYFPEPWVSSKVQCVKWWMGHYQSKTPKRHYAYGNTCVILGLDRGRLRKWKPTGGVKTVTAERYVDSKGKKRYKGTSKLRSTEKLGSDPIELLESVSIYIIFVPGSNCYLYFCPPQRAMQIFNTQQFPSHPKHISCRGTIQCHSLERWPTRSREWRCLVGDALSCQPVSQQPFTPLLVWSGPKVLSFGSLLA